MTIHKKLVRPEARIYLSVDPQGGNSTYQLLVQLPHRVDQSAPELYNAQYHALENTLKNTTSNYIITINLTYIWK